MSVKVDDVNGVWRTIGGRRVFIKDGQDLASAMKESGKFKKSQIKNAEIDKKENPYATNNKGGIDDNSSEFADRAIKHWEDENAKYKEKYGKDDEMAKSFKERWEKEKNNRLYGEQKAKEEDDYTKRSIEANKPAGQKMADMIKESGVKTFADEIKESEKYASAKHEGFGDYNKDNIPVYNNKIDYTGDFGRNADLSKLSNEELKEAIKIQQQELDKANSEKIGDQRTRNGKMDKIFNTARKQQYEEGVKLLKEESIRRENEKYPEYEKKGYGVKYYSVEDVAKDPNSKMNQYIRAEKERKAYKKYLKLHPNSEISFEQFKDMNKK